MFFETPSVRYCCDIIQCMFMFISLSQYEFEPPYKIQSVAPMGAVIVHYDFFEESCPRAASFTSVAKYVVCLCLFQKEQKFFTDFDDDWH